MLGIIIQARMGSTRLPGKVLMNIGNKSLLEHIFFRLAFLKHKAMVVLATSNHSHDDIIEQYCIDRNIECFRGDEHNVLQRYYFCAKKYGFKDIVRLTADNPFTDIEELDNLIDLYFEEHSDFANSFEELPIGVGAEIFSFTALERSYYEGREPHHVEHVDEYLLENPDVFTTSILKVCKNKQRPDIRLTIDTMDDYNKACYIVRNSANEFITTEEAIELCMAYV